MPQINIDLFKLDFENFVREKNVNNSPAFGISYRVRNSHYITEEDSSTTYELNSQNESSHDFNFISGVNNKLEKISEAEIGNFPFKINVTTISLNLPNKPDDSQEDLATFLYVYMGMEKSFYEQQKPRDAKSLMENIGISTLFWGLKKGKKPLELIFNYHLQESPNELLRHFKDKELNKFIKSHSPQDF